MIVNTVVDTDPVDAFEVFTNDIDQWWKRTPRHMSRYDMEPRSNLKVSTCSKFMIRRPP